MIMRMRITNTRHKNIKILRYLTAPATKCGEGGYLRFPFLREVKVFIRKNKENEKWFIRAKVR